MKKIFLLFMFFVFTFGNIYAADIIDDSILKELEKGEIKKLDFDFNLKSFESCNDLNDVMSDYIKEYWENNKDMYR
jgi:hypothetical protein